MEAVTLKTGLKLTNVSNKLINATRIINKLIAIRGSLVKDTRLKILSQKVKLPKTAMNKEISNVSFQTGNCIFIIMIHKFKQSDQCNEILIRVILGKVPSAVNYGKARLFDLRI